MGKASLSPKLEPNTCSFEKNQYIKNAKVVSLHNYSAVKLQKSDVLSFKGNPHVRKIIPLPRIERADYPFITPDIVNKRLEELRNDKTLPENLRKYVDKIPADDPYVATYNPGACEDIEGGSHILARCTRGDYPVPKVGNYFASELWYAHSDDGLTLDEKSLFPVIVPMDEPYKVGCDEINKHEGAFNGTTPPGVELGETAKTDSQEKVQSGDYINTGWGFEDPRKTILKDKNGNKYYQIVCTAYNGINPFTVGFKTTDLSNPDAFEFQGVIGPKKCDVDTDEDRKAVGGDKDAAFYTLKDGTIMMLHRFKRDIQAVPAGILLDPNTTEEEKRAFWREHLKPETLEKDTVLKARNTSNNEDPTLRTWEYKLGGGPPPIPVKVDGKDYLLMIFHSSNNYGKKIENREYFGGVALLSPDGKVLHRGPEPILRSEKLYEKKGPVPNVVFPQGLAVKKGSDKSKGDDLLIYYGGADKCVGVGTVNINELVRYTRQFDTNGDLAEPEKASKVKKIGSKAHSAACHAVSSVKNFIIKTYDRVKEAFFTQKSSN